MEQNELEQEPSAENRVFEEPWEGRAFALATALHERGAFAWPDFQRRLVEEIEAWNAVNDVDDTYSYYRLWLRALERLIDESELCDLGGLDTRVDELGRANPGHDHVARRQPIAVEGPRDS
jgi:nitrile hydratase accessory protein